ncbi:sporulation integral membrane protein YlbJ [Clostridium sediminicola]|uniref:sporulation integral membrane protein YlbJ n=1 Tax=Clostridium sediminicola TaxID=3114879 RepID=UPI003D172BB8
MNENIVVTFICSFIILSIITNPSLTLTATLDGAILFVKSVFVSIFPFLVIINIMFQYGGINIYSKIFGNLLCTPLKFPKNCSVVLIVSALCGYPLGAKYAIDLYSNRKIDFDTCNRLISVASNPSPLFVIGVVGVKILNNKFIGYILLISMYLSCIFMALIIRPHNSNYRTKTSTKVPLSQNIQTKNLGTILKNSISDGLVTSLNIGGFVILFSVIINIIKNNTVFDIVFHQLSLILHISEKISRSFILGLIELTNGCNEVNLISISQNNKIIIISFLLGFSGFSIIAQVSSFISKENFSVKKYTIYKFIQGIICSVITFALLKIDIFSLNKKVFFNTNSIPNANIEMSILSLFVIILLIIPLFIQKLFDSIS